MADYQIYGGGGNNPCGAYYPAGNAPYTAPEFQSVQFETKNNKYLAAKFDASIFNPRQSGEIEFRFYLPEPDKAIEIIKSRMSK